MFFVKRDIKEDTFNLQFIRFLKKTVINTFNLSEKCFIQ